MRESDAAGIAEAQTKMQLCQISISRKRIIPIPEFGLDQFVLGKELVPLSNFNSIVLLMPPTVPFSFHDNSNTRNARVRELRIEMMEGTYQGLFMHYSLLLISASGVDK